MAWKTRTAMEERKAFLEEWNRGEVSRAELCRRYGISRKTGYKWKRRWEANGESGLADQSRAPKRQARAVSAERQTRIVAVRRAHATWGPRKILDYLERESPEESWPAHSTVDELLRREGLVRRRKRLRRAVPNASPLQHAEESNRIWTMDFKGWFLLGNGERCDPLTVQDAFSRMVLRVRGVKRTDTGHVWDILEALFRENGMPEKIRTDNGPPFASAAPAGLSRLAMEWIRRGIGHERIRPGHPEQNGRHERMHRTLLEETASPPAGNYASQQKRFALFEQHFNFERPHAALQGATPGSIYVASPRAWCSRTPVLEYPDQYLVRRVATHGDIFLNGERVFITEILAHETVGLRQVEETVYEVYWSTVHLGWLDNRSYHFKPVSVPRRRKPGKPAEAKEDRESETQT